MAKETTYDILPESWISYNGEIPSTGLTGRIVVLPTPDEEDISWPVTSFLVKGNRLETGKFEFTTRSEKKVRIRVVRLNPKTNDIRLDIKPISHRVLRELGWAEFRRLQKEFEQYLLKASQCRCICALFSKPPRSRFSNNYEPLLRSFWLGCLRGATADSLSRNVFGSLAFRPPNSTPIAPATPATEAIERPAGKAMGVLPLYPGMRLSIHWGGTANYSYTGSVGSVVRPTVSGTTTVSIVSRQGKIGFGTNQDWRLSSFSPAQGSTGTPIPPKAPMPFGFGQEEEFGGRVLPISNELDLWQSGGLGSSSARAVILVPAIYVKPDMASPDGKSFTKDSNTPFHQDALNHMGEEPPVSGKVLAKSLSRRFLLWRGDRINPLDFDLSFELNDVKKWSPTLAFGNQTFVTPELPVMINGQTPVWLNLGTTWDDVLRTYAPWSLAATADLSNKDPILTMRRALLTSQSKSDAAAEFSSVICRFWVLPLDQLLPAQVFPGDAIFFRP